VLERSRGQAQAGENHCETQTRRLPEWTLQHDEKAGHEEEDRKRISSPQLPDGKPAKLESNHRAPDQESKTEDRAALEQNARPFIFREEERSLPGEEAGAAARADAEPVTA